MLDVAKSRASYSIRGYRGKRGSVGTGSRVEARATPFLAMLSRNDFEVGEDIDRVRVFESGKRPTVSRPIDPF